MSCLFRHISDIALVGVARQRLAHGLTNTYTFRNIFFIIPGRSFPNDLPEMITKILICMFLKINLVSYLNCFLKTYILVPSTPMWALIIMDSYCINS